MLHTFARTTVGRRQLTRARSGRVVEIIVLVGGKIFAVNSRHMWPLRTSNQRRRIHRHQTETNGDDLAEEGSARRRGGDSPIGLELVQALFEVLDGDLKS